MNLLSEKNTAVFAILAVIWASLGLILASYAAFKPDRVSQPWTSSDDALVEQAKAAVSATISSYGYKLAVPLQFNAISRDPDGEARVNFTIRFVGGAPAKQISVILTRSDYRITNIREVVSP